jgi:hypothetical protein
MNASATKAIEQKWDKVLNNPKLQPIKDAYRRQCTAMLMENTEHAMIQDAQAQGGASLLTEDAPANAAGAFPRSNLQGYDPILISLIRRSAPNLIAYDICGVQPMSGPTGLIFALKSKYTTQAGTEALFNEANVMFSSAGLTGNASQLGTTPAGSNSTNYTSATGMTTAQGEALGTYNVTSNAYTVNNATIPEMAFSIDKVTATAVTRALKAEYTIEIAQDLKAVHGLDAEAELANILSTEILTEINREIIRVIGFAATSGAQHNTSTAGTFDLDLDSNGRWSVERWKGLVFQLERDSNAIAKATRRGRGNVLITSSDVASALQQSGQLDYAPALEAKTKLETDDTGPTFVGVLNGHLKVFIDPYVPAASTDYAIVGYKGQSPYDAGLFYCPYVPLQMMRAVDPGSFQPKIGFKTRYAVVSNPFTVSDGTVTYNTNIYYRKFTIANLQ